MRVWMVTPPNPFLLVRRNAGSRQDTLRSESFVATESLYRNRRIVYTGLIVFATLAAIDALPQYTVLHGKLKRWVDPILDVTGLWQGSWALFAPTPDHVNVRIGATLEGANGHRVVWSQPDWNAMTPWTKMRMFRQMSYYDNIWRGENSAAWPALIEWLVLHHGDGQT